jgi:hypothetical protein
MSKLYIHDSTIGKYVTFNTVPQLVSYLNTMIPRAFKMQRNEYVQNLIDLGHGYDDPKGVMVTRAMAEEFDMGVIRENKYIRTDIHELSSFQDEGYGN